ncbi:MAG: transcriptional regulator, MarR family [Actinomycetia bacterium]|nr:transcriptional regulator, MarR family [Actinomycetes bacterium]
MLDSPTKIEPASPDPKEPSIPPTWTLLLRAHAAATQQISGLLQAEHRLSINDYETLSALAHAPGRRLRRVDLARRLLLTPSGVTRLLDRLEDSGLVERAGSDVDLRVAYAQLTVTGAAKLEAAARNHVAAICALLEACLSAPEIAQLGDLLGRLSAV